jgi:hypothetical protein
MPGGLDVCTTLRRVGTAPAYIRLSTHPTEAGVRAKLERRDASSRRSGLERRFLDIYLKDHHAGAVGGAELARRAARNNRGHDLGGPLEDLSQEIDDDRESLLDLMRALGISPDPIKQAAMWLLEKAGRLKPNGAFLSYSPLSRVMELEALEAGVQGKRELWSALLRIAGTDPRLRVAELRRLESRAAAQLERLETLRLRACEEALTAAPAAGELST